jgi:DNA-binding HxlR family transcriptional regulator
VLGRTYEDQVCSIARSLEVLGERWTLLIVRDAILGLRRFDEFRTSLGVARNVLTDRLGRLIEAGIMERVPYQTGPVRYEYLLTPAGRELGIPVIGLMHWGDRHRPEPAGPPRLTLHDGCGGAVRLAFRCEECDAVVPPGELSLVRGPGAPAAS